MKRCSRCRLTLPLDHFSDLKHTRDGKQSWCKPCRAAYSRQVYGRDSAVRREQKVEYRRQNRERLREYNQRWRAQNIDRERAGKRLREARRRARQQANLTLPFTEEQLLARLSMFAGCWICGEVADQVDHVKPIARGGAHILANLRPICGFCNQSKKDRWPLVEAA